MGIGGMRGWQLVIVIVVIVLLIFGPKNLPKLGSAIGGFTKNLKSGLKEAQDEAEGEDEEVEVEDEDADEDEEEKPKAKGKKKSEE